MWFYIEVFFEYLSRKFQFPQNLTRVMGALDENQYKYFAHLFVKWEMFRTKVVENMKTHILQDEAYVG